MRQPNVTALSYWFPKLKKANLPMPVTIILKTPREAVEAFWAAQDGMDGGDIRPFAATIRAAAEAAGFPAFLRTDHTSNKHNWQHACFLTRRSNVANQLFKLMEFSEIVGLPWDNFVVRKMLPVEPFGFCKDYGGMPIVKEFRCFVTDGNIDCIHPYWPQDAINDGEPEWIRGNTKENYASLCEMVDEVRLREIAQRAGAVLGGRWSIDLLWTTEGWYITDLAEAHKSFHWEGCEAHKLTLMGG